MLINRGSAGLQTYLKSRLTLNYLLESYMVLGLIMPLSCSNSERRSFDAFNLLFRKCSPREDLLGSRLYFPARILFHLHDFAMSLQTLIYDELESMTYVRLLVARSSKEKNNEAPGSQTKDMSLRSPPHFELFLARSPISSGRNSRRAKLQDFF
jgi:hypothetical protein